MSHSSFPPLSSFLALTLLVIMGTFWGLQFAMLKLAASGGHSELTVLMVALVLLSLVFFAITMLKGHRFRLARHMVPFFVITSILGYVVPLLATLHAAPHLSAGVLVMLASLSPVAAIATALAWRSERVTVVRMAAVALAIVSIGMIFWPELTLPGLGDANWMLLALVVPLTYGFESVYIARFWPDGLSPLEAVTGESIIATLLMLPVFLLYGDPVPSAWTWGPAETGIAVFVAAGVIESLIYFYLIRQTGGVFVNFGTFVALFAGIAWGMVLFGETHPATVWLAVVVLVVALWLAVRDGSGETAQMPLPPPV